MKLMSIMIVMSSIPMGGTALYMLKNSTFISLEIPLMLNDLWNFKISFILDWTSCLFSTTVMFITAMILMYSMSYMPESEHKQFMLIMMMFVLSMLFLINSNNLIFMLLGWDGLGISSYILVILYQNPKSGASGSITILSNRIGDALIIISISLIFMSSSWNFFSMQMNTKLIIMLLLIASCTKSAQFPFSAWLPAAMAAPTPISALVHSSTLVTAGVFLMIRVTEYSNINMLLTLMVMASSTTIYASLTACWEQDMKKIIAFSTLSQIAMMMFTISLMSPNLAFFHLITHALFKSMMFMAAGLVIMNSSYQDMRHMGSMIKSSPIISSIMGISMMALMGIPFMSGFFSKDMILEMMLKSSFVQILSILMISSVSMTTIYSLRMMKLTFKMIMKSKKDLTLSPYNFMETPLMLMAPMSIITGAMMSWISMPTQSYHLPLLLKMMVLTALFMGVIFSLNMNFISYKYLVMGYTIITIWFIHTMSTKPPLKFNNTFMKILNFDKNWMETYGPNMIFYSYKNFSSNMGYSMLSPMFILMMVSMFIMMLMIIN